MSSNIERSNDEKDKSGIVGLINKIAPTGFVTILTASILWVANNTTSANVQLAVQAVKLATIQESIDNMKKDIVAENNNKYSLAQATADKAILQSEITHIREESSELKLRIAALEKTITK